MGMKMSAKVWLTVAVLLLTDSYCKAALSLPHRTRTKRQAEIEEDLGSVFTRFLTADPETQQDYLRYGLELAEYHLLESYDGIKDKTGAQDKAFLDSVQNAINAVRRASSDPSEAPSALAALATNPDNLLLFTSLVVSTVFVAQLSSLVLTGSSLAASGTEKQDGESPETEGLMGLIRDALNILPNLLNLISQAFQDVVDGRQAEEGSGSGSGSGSGDGEEDGEQHFIGLFGSGDDDGEVDAERVGLFAGIMNFFASLFPISENEDEDDTQKLDDAEDDEEGSGEDKPDGLNFGFNVVPGSILDMIINLIPSPPESSGDNNDDAVKDLEDPNSLGEHFGGISISLEPIDLANLFIQVNDVVGANCTCDEGMSEDMITNATLRLLEENLQEAQKFSQYSGLNDQKKEKKSSKKRGGKHNGRRQKSPMIRIPKSIID